MPITENILPHLNYFWHVARQMNFTKAAKVLHISQSAVSLQVKTLEEKLNTQLFLRKSKNNLALSPSGHKLYEHCQAIFQEVDHTMDELLKKETEGTLMVSSAAAFGILIMVPFIHQLESKFPNLKVHLDVTDAFADFSNGQTDLAIRWGHPNTLKLNYDTLASEKFILAASPKYLKRTPPIRTPKDLDLHTLIVRQNRIDSWTTWIQTFPKKLKPTMKNVRHISNTFAMIAAVKLGMGISLFSKYAIREHLQKKELVQVLPEYPCTPLPFHICYPQTKYPNPKVALFASELRQYLQSKYGSQFFI